MIRTLYIPGIEKSVTLAAYVKAIRIAKANRSATFKNGLTCWWPCIGQEIMDQFRDGMMDRINQAIPYLERGITE